MKKNSVATNGNHFAAMLLSVMLPRVMLLFVRS
jgi:hypothetical protein